MHVLNCALFVNSVARHYLYWRGGGIKQENIMQFSFMKHKNMLVCLYLFVLPASDFYTHYIIMMKGLLLRSLGVICK